MPYVGALARSCDQSSHVITQYAEGVFDLEIAMLDSGNIS